MAKHLKYGGSTMHRTLVCGVWAALAEQLSSMAEISSYAADEGSLLHSIMEDIFKQLKADPYAPIEFSKYLKPAWTYGQATFDQELLDEKIIPAFTATLDLLEELDIEPSDLEIEPFVEYLPDLAGGSIDLFGVNVAGDMALVLDYKFGRYDVAVHSNPQLMFYALSADAHGLIPNSVEVVTLAIIQPMDGKCEAKEWDFEIAELDDFEDRVMAAIRASEDGTGEAVEGPHCHFCPAAPICPLKQSQARVAAKLPTDTAANLAASMSLVPELKQWIAQVEAAALNALQHGNPVEGWKLVNKRAVRKWTDENTVAEVCQGVGFALDEVTDTKLKTPAQMEKVFSKKGVDPKLISDYIIAQSSGTTIAPADDNRADALPTKALAQLGKKS